MRGRERGRGREKESRKKRSGASNKQGDKSNNIDKYAWHKDNSGGVLQKVGLKNPNLYGIYDMHGNAAEWVLDSYDPTV